MEITSERSMVGERHMCVVKAARDFLHDARLQREKKIITYVRMNQLTLGVKALLHINFLQRLANQVRHVGCKFVVDRVPSNRQVFILLHIHIIMQTWLIIVFYLFTARGSSLADLDLFTGDFTGDSTGDSTGDFAANNDESLFQYNEVGTEPIPTSLAWDLDDASLPQEGALLAGTLDYTNACASDSAEPAVKLRARGPVCESDDTEGTGGPGRRTKSFSWLLKSHEISPAALATSLEEFSCNNQGFRYAVCDSGGFYDVERMLIAPYYTLINCDLCMFVGESLPDFCSGNSAESKRPVETLAALY